MVTINELMVQQLAETAKNMPDVRPLDFYHTLDGQKHDDQMYPELNHPQIVAFLFLGCLHEYGFWYGNHLGYTEPLYVTLDGQRYEGSDALWRCLKHALDTQPELFLPQRLANLTEQEMWQELFVCNGAPFALPDPAQRLERTRAFGQHCAEYLTDLADFMSVHQVQRQARPLEHFLSVVKRMPGFHLDPLQKRQRLLAMALINRPEKFLRPARDERLGPIVDYHLMRVALRLGLVEFVDKEAAAKNRQRAWVGAAMEHGIRRNVHKALARVIELSSVAPDKLDYALWSARDYCPEMSPPICAQCRFNTICAKRIDLFQPVIRTTSY